MANNKKNNKDRNNGTDNVTNYSLHFPSSDFYSNPLYKNEKQPSENKQKTSINIEDSDEQKQPQFSADVFPQQERSQFIQPNATEAPVCNNPFPQSSTMSCFQNTNNTFEANTPSEKPAEYHKNEMSETEKLLSDAKKQAEDIIEKAKQEAQRIKNEALIENESLKAALIAKQSELNAFEEKLYTQQLKLSSEKRLLDEDKQNFDNDKAEAMSKIIAKANYHADGIITNARTQEAELIAFGKTKKSRLIAEGEAERDRKIAEATREAIEKSVEGRLKELFSESNAGIAKERQDLNDIYTNISEQNTAFIKSLGTASSAISLELNNALSNCITAINDNLSKIIGVQNTVTSTLDSWQRGLYKNQLTQLAICFTTLNRFIDAHQNNLTVFESKKGDPISDAKAEQLIPIIKTLTIFREQLSKAIAVLGISTYYPKENEPFDPNFHAVEDVYAIPDMLIDHPIKECINPGFKKAGFDEPEAVLSKAVVTVKTASPQF